MSFNKEEDFYKKTDEVMSKFPHAKQLYHSSAVFHSIVQCLVRGQSEYEVIEQLVIMMEDSNKAMQNYIVKDPYHRGFDLLGQSNIILENEIKAFKLK